MAELKDKVENALNESRTIILGAEVVLAFEYQSFFMDRFSNLPYQEKAAMLVGLELMLVTVVLLIWPAPYHQIVTENKNSEDLNLFTTRVTTIALLTFALSMSVDFYTVVNELTEAIFWGVLAAAILMVVALFFWYGWETFSRWRAQVPKPWKSRMQNTFSDAKDEQKQDIPLKDKIKQVMTETRIVLPGIQALVAFQFSIFLSQSFDKLAPVLKYLHLTSLSSIIFSMILLMTPAAYHRIVLEGEDTEYFLNFSSRMVLTSLVFLAVGLALDFYVVTHKVTESTPWSLLWSVLLLALFLGAWFAYSFLRKNQLKSRR